MAAPEDEELLAALLESAGQGRLDDICSLLTRNPDLLNTRGMFGKRLADATRGFSGRLQELRAEGLGPSANRVLTQTHTSHHGPGISVAHIAAFYGQWHVLEFLSAKGAKYLFVEADDGGTPAHHAAAAGRTGEDVHQRHCRWINFPLQRRGLIMCRLFPAPSSSQQRRSSSSRHRAYRTWLRETRMAGLQRTWPRITAALRFGQMCSEGEA